MNFETKYDIGDKAYIFYSAPDSAEEVSITDVLVSRSYDPFTKEPVTKVEYRAKTENSYETRIYEEKMLFKTKKDAYRHFLKGKREYIKSLEKQCQELQKLIKEKE